MERNRPPSGPNEPKQTSVESTLPSSGPGYISRLDALPESLARLLQQRPLFIGDVLANRYKLIQALGDGAMGQVFIASNLAINQRVAIKVLKPELLADTSFRQRFQREAEAIAAVDHRNVARFLDLVVGDPTFLVMEYVPGPTLAAILGEEKQLAWPRAAAITLGLCRALEAAHRAGVIHRDIKPANVVLTRNAELSEEPKLIDFGLAKLASASGASAALTRAGQVVGTPDYMSPEQIQGAPVDGRSDVYALGCLLYHLVAGRAPFIGEAVEVLFRQLHQKPESIARFAPTAPPTLRAVVERAMAKDPDKRFQSMAEMARKLERILDALAVQSDLSEPLDEAAVCAPRGDQAPAHEGSAAAVRRWRRLAALALLSPLVAALVYFVSLRSDAARTLLVITTDPPGAAVTVDGKPTTEPTPTALRGIAAADHVVSVRRDGYGTVERHVDVARGERRSLYVRLPPQTRRVELHSTPEGASAHLDGLLVSGLTPTTILIAEDDFHEVRLERNGYEPAIHAIKPDERETVLTVRLQAETRPRGYVSVDSDGIADVWIDGINTGHITPTVGIQVAVGRHVVELHSTGGAHTQPVEVDVHQGQSLSVTLRAPVDANDRAVRP